MSTTERPTIKAMDEHDEAVGQTLGRYKLLERSAKAAAAWSMWPSRPSRCAAGWR